MSTYSTNGRVSGLASGNGPVLAALRTRLIANIWPTGRPTNAVPTSVTRTLNPAECPEAAWRDLLTWDLGHGLTQRTYLYAPNAAVTGVPTLDRVMWWSAGHDCDVSVDPHATHMRGFLAKGWYVVGLTMLFQGYNQPAPVTITGVSGVTSVSVHNDLANLDSHGVSGMATLLDHIVMTGNYLQANYPQLKTWDIGGLSGGGWTAMMTGAVDTRFRNVFEVAGSTNDYIHIYVGEGADYEQWGAPWQSGSGATWATVPVMWDEVYVLAGYNRPSNGKVYQIHNWYDYYFNDSTPGRIVHVNRYVQTANERLGYGQYGTFLYYSDTSHGASDPGSPLNHIVSDWAKTNVIYPAMT